MEVHLLDWARGAFIREATKWAVVTLEQLQSSTGVPEVVHSANLVVVVEI